MAKSLGPRIEMIFTRRSRPQCRRHCRESSRLNLSISIFVGRGGPRISRCGIRSSRTPLRDSRLRSTVNLLDELAGEDVRQHRKLRMVFRAGVSGLAALTVVSVFAAAAAIINRNRAENRRFVSIAQALAARAPTEQSQAHDHERAALLARQAYFFNRDHGGARLSEVDSALRAVMGAPHFSTCVDITSEEVTASAVDRDRQLLAVALANRTVQIWRIDGSRRATRVLNHEEGRIGRVGFDASRSRIVGVSDQGVQLTWSLQDGSSDPVVHSLDQWEANHGDMAIGDDGRRLAVALPEGCVRVWNLATPDEIPLRLCSPEDPARVRSVAFSPGDSKSLVGGLENGSVIIWRLDGTASMTHRLQGHDGPVSALALSRDGGSLAIGTAWRLPDWTSIGLDAAADLAPVGGTVGLWDLQRTPFSFSVLGHHESDVRLLNFDSDGQYLASSAGGDQLVRLWDLNRPQAFFEDLWGHDGVVANIAFSTEGTHLISVDRGRIGSNPSSFRTWKLDRPVGRPYVFEGHQGSVVSLAFSRADGRLVSVGNTDETAFFWDIAKGEVVDRRMLENAPATSVALNPDGTKLAVGSGSFPGFDIDNAVRLWDLNRSDGAPKTSLGHGSDVESIAFSCDGEFLASAGYFGSEILLWSLDDFSEPTMRINAGAGRVPTLAFHPKEPLLAWGSDDGAVRILALFEPSKEPLLLPGHSGVVTGVAFGTRGHLLASCGLDGKILVWRLDQSPPTLSVSFDHLGEARAVAIDDSERVVAAGSADGIIRVWNLDNPENDPIELDAGMGPVYSVQINPAGELIAGGTARNAVVVWHSTTSLLTEVCRSVTRNLSDEEWSRFIAEDIPCQEICPGKPACDDPRLSVVF